MCNTKHKPDCKMAFGRKDESCARCRELLAGSPVRQWAGSQKKRNEELLTAAIKAHYKNGVCSCGPVCTKFEW